MTARASKDYYAILGLERGASEEEIKHAYRELVRRNHPDANPGNPGAESQFKEINEAYSVLADPEKRREYDSVVLGRDNVQQRRQRSGAAREAAPARSRQSGSSREVVVDLDVAVAGLSVGLGIVDKLLDGLGRGLSTGERAASRRRPPPESRSNGESNSE